MVPPAGKVTAARLRVYILDDSLEQFAGGGGWGAHAAAIALKG